MLHKFIDDQRSEIIERTRRRVKSRTWPSVSADELEFGVPLFLTQLSETLRLESTGGTPRRAGCGTWTRSWWVVGVGTTGCC